MSEHNKEIINRAAVVLFTNYYLRAPDQRDYRTGAMATYLAQAKEIVSVVAPDISAAAFHKGQLSMRQRAQREAENATNGYRASVLVGALECDPHNSSYNDDVGDELLAYRAAAEYDATMEGPRFKGWNRSQLERARLITFGMLMGETDQSPPLPAKGPRP